MLTLVLLLACAPAPEVTVVIVSPVEDTADTGGLEDTAEEEPVVYGMLIEDLAYTVDALRWDYQVGFVGWADTCTLDIVQYYATGTWEEYHDMENTASAEDGSWDEYTLTLTVVGGYLDQVDSVSTIYTESMIPQMGWEVSAMDHLGEVDCAVSGQMGSWFGNGCRSL